MDEEREVGGSAAPDPFPSGDGLMYLTHQVPKISTPHSPITNLEHRFALRANNDQALSDCLGRWSPGDSVIAKAQCKRMFQIGDRRMQSADFGNLMRQA
jgi:hypothetical protein